MALDGCVVRLWTWTKPHYDAANTSFVMSFHGSCYKLRFVRAFALVLVIDCCLVIKNDKINTIEDVFGIEAK